MMSILMIEISVEMRNESEIEDIQTWIALDWNKV